MAHRGGKKWRGTKSGARAAALAISITVAAAQKLENLRKANSEDLLNSELNHLRDHHLEFADGMGAARPTRSKRSAYAKPTRQF